MKPHVLLVISDQMQGSRLGKLDPVAHTPNLDRLADEGAWFPEFHSASGQCVPSRACIQTGLHPHESGILINYGMHGHTARLDASHKTVGQVFRENGYATAYFGKSHLGRPLEELGYDTGVEVPSDDHPRSDADRRNARRAADFVLAHGGDRPLFMVVSFHLPHRPLEKIRRFAHRFRPGRIQLPTSFGKGAGMQPPDYLADRAQDVTITSANSLRRELRRYYTMIAEVDRLFGTLRRAFEKRRMWDQTIAAFTSDHGEMMGAQSLRRKGPMPYEEIFRVPLVLKIPGLCDARGRVDALAVNTALAGTLIEGAGIPRPESFRGGSLLPVLARDSASGDEPIFYGHYGGYWGIHPFRIVRTRRYKYVKFHQGGREELYDLDRDPHELENLAGDEDFEAKRRELEVILDDWWTRTGGFEGPQGDT